MRASEKAGDILGYLAIHTLSWQEIFPGLFLTFLECKSNPWPWAEQVSQKSSKLSPILFLKTFLVSSVLLLLINNVFESEKAKQV